MKLRLNESPEEIVNVEIEDTQVNSGVVDILIDFINKKWDNIRDLNSIIVTLQGEGYDDMCPVVETILEDENTSIGKLQQLIELVSPSTQSIEDGKQQAISELDGESIITVESFKEDKMSSKKSMKENFNNVPDDIQACVDSTFKKSNEEHDLNKEKYEDAIEQNKKFAEETVPKEGETGKKITSKALKQMHLNENLFEESWVEDTPFKIESVGNGIYKLSQNGIINDRLSIEADSKEEAKQILLANGWKESELTEEIDKPVRYRVRGYFDSSYRGLDTSEDADNWSTVQDIAHELLSKGDNVKVNDYETGRTLEITSDEYDGEGIEEFMMESVEKPKRYSDGKTGKWWYFTTHGVQPGSIPKDLNVLDIIDTDNGTYVALDGILNTSELKQYDMKEKWPEGLEESLKYQVAKEQLARFNEGKMPQDWKPEHYIKKLVEKKHLSKEEGERLLSESTHKTLTEAIDDISLGNFQTKLKKVILNLKEAYDDLNPNVDKFDVASTIINGSLNDLKMLDKAIQEFNSEETM